MALETLGAMSASAREFLTQIVRRLTEVTTDPRETAFFSTLVGRRLTIQCGLPSRPDCSQFRKWAQKLINEQMNADKISEYTAAGRTRNRYRPTGWLCCRPTYTHRKMTFNIQGC